MSCNLFVDCSIWNFSAKDGAKFLKFLKNKKFDGIITLDEDGDLIIDQDFDRAIIRLLLEFLGEIPEDNDFYANIPPKSTRRVN